MQPRTSNIQLVIYFMVDSRSVERFRLHIEHGVVLESYLNGGAGIQYPFVDDSNPSKRIVYCIILIFHQSSTSCSYTHRTLRDIEGS